MQISPIRSRWLFLVGIVLAGVVAGGVLGTWAARNGYPIFTSGFVTPAFAGSNNVAQPGPAPRILPDSFAPVIQPDLPGVVTVFTTSVVKRNYSASPFFNDPFFRQFFGNQFGQAVPQKEYALGSGFVVRSDGIILTNYHVVQGATDVHVTFENQTRYKAKILGTDPQTDLAVLKIEATDLTALPLGDSNQMRVGDIVFAIGDPLNIGKTVTMGIVSAKGRTQVEPTGPLSIQNFIQTDAAINHGNSGGPLINTMGQVIGVDTAIATEGGQGNIGIGFAIPINLAKYVFNQIVAHGKVSRGQLGVTVQGWTTPELAKQFGLPKPEGALISSVAPGSPAEKAGLKQGDVILKFNGDSVKDNNDLVMKVTETPPGTTVHLEVFRNGRTLPIDVTLEERPTSLSANAQTPSAPTPSTSALAGVEVQTLTPEIANQLNLAAGTTGVVVAQIDPNSVAAGAGLQRGDVIQEVNHHHVANLAEYNQAVQAAGSNTVLLLVNRGGGAIYIVISPNGD